MTTVERFDDASGTWDAITYGSWTIENGVSDVLIAPEATVGVPRTEAVATGDRIRIREDATTIYEGGVDAVKPRRRGPAQVESSHDAYGLFEETVSLSESGTDADVLNAALSAAAGTWTLDYAGTATSLGDAYEVTDRRVKRVFRDMVDRVGRIWWVGVDHTIHVEPYGDRGTLASIDTATDPAVVEEYTAGDLESVINDVTVIGTGGEQVRGSADDSQSISDYGRQPETVNVSYIRSSGEATAYASELLNPEPDASATVTAAASIAGPTPQVNHTLAVTDAQGTGMDAELPIEHQTVSQGSNEFELGEGAGTNVEKFNRQEKSKSDVTEPGSVYGNDRIADDAIDSDQLVDTAVIAEKIADLSITETKIQDGSISTPKLQAFAVTANAIDAGAVTAVKIRAGEITANEIDTLDLETQQLSIGSDVDERILFETGTIGTTDVVRMVPEADGFAIIGDDTDRFNALYTRIGNVTELQIDPDALSAIQSAVIDSDASLIPTVDNAVRLGTGPVSETNLEQRGWSDVVTHNVTTLTPEPLDGVGPTDITDYSWRNPPAYVAQKKADGEDDREYRRHNPRRGVELSHLVNYLWETCRAQARELDAQADRLDDLESRIDALEAAADPNA